MSAARNTTRAEWNDLRARAHRLRIESNLLARSPQFASRAADDARRALAQIAIPVDTAEALRTIRWRALSAWLGRYVAVRALLRTVRAEAMAA